MISSQKITIRRFKAFTLAEVLITLTVIGIIASMTIPSLLNDIQYADLSAKNKELRALLMRAHLKLRADNGDTVDGLNYGKELAKLLFTARDCVNHPSSNACFYGNNTAKRLNKDGTYKYISTNTNQGLLLNNGMMLRIWSGTLDCTARTSTSTDPNACWPVVNYKSGYCTYFYADLNGEKGPNTWGLDLREVSVYGNQIYIYGDDNLPSRWSGQRNPKFDLSEYQAGGSCYDSNDYSATNDL